MFAYDPVLLAAVKNEPDSVADVLRTMRAIDANCIEGDGLKWFNWLYLQVTTAVDARIQAGGFTDPAWLSQLDVEFAKFYFAALEAELTGGAPSSCWRVLFDMRQASAVTRIQFALAGINAHINHDLPAAIVKTAVVLSTSPNHDDPHYADYTALNTTLDSLIDMAKQTLLVRLSGEPLPVVSQVEDLIAAFSVSAAREAAWRNAELLWHLRDSTLMTANLMGTLDGLTTVANKTLLTAVI